MSGVFQNIDPPPPHRPASVYPPAFGAGEDTLAAIVWSLEDANTALYSIICKYFVNSSICNVLYTWLSMFVLCLYT
jgi:hypothetical protein